ncbi:hypothetical protein [Bacillus arachidis]|uniref:Uncharacterized protein n=1 Tax=Bacillus arachidis TaxID=2819290 RepID=A0ABS3P4A1_9BACI|nr:hypothetical protein [Bacillus arachidis]MBO1628009.1 hypothetical protein [Bacillus arachidis]
MDILGDLGADSQPFKGTIEKEDSHPNFTVIFSYQFEDCSPGSVAKFPT